MTNAPHRNPSDDELRRLLVEARTIAMVGASSNPEKASHGIMRQLLAAGYRVIPVNPRETEVLGQKAVPSLDAIREPVDIVDVFRRSEDTPEIADEASKLGAKALWLQLGVSNEAAAAKASAAGLAVVMDKCIGATHSALHVPPKAPAPAAPSPLASPEPWDLVRDGYVSELWDQFSDFAKDALELAKVAPGAEVLDVCTGPGTLAVQAAATARRVVGVDFSPRMLEELRRRAGASGLSNVEAVEADGQALPFDDASFDAAFSMFGLIFFPDRGKGFRELLRVLRPGGHAVVSSWRPFDTVPPIKAAFQALLELMPELPFGKNKAPLGEADEFRAELADAGFTAIDVVVVSHKSTASSPGAFWTSMARSSAPFVLMRRRIGEERWAALSDGILARLTDRFGPGPLDIEPQALLGIGTRKK